MNPWESYEGPANTPEDCTAWANPTADTVDCEIEYQAHEGEITNVWLVPATFNTGTGLYEAAATPANWLSKPDLNATAGVAHFEVVGDKPLGEPRSVALPRFRTKVVDRTHNMTIDITHASVNNYDFVRFYQTPGIYAALWYADFGGHVFGGENGVICWVPNAGNAHARGQGSLRTGQILLQWTNLYNPPIGVMILTASPQMAPGAPIPQRIDRPPIHHVAPSIQKQLDEASAKFEAQKAEAKENPDAKRTRKATNSATEAKS